MRQYFAYGNTCDYDHKTNQSLLLISFLSDDIKNQIVESRVQFISSKDAVEHGIDPSVPKLYECICFSGVAWLTCEKRTEIVFPGLKVKSKPKP